ncbi:MAG: MATE family efflux transporter [Clostridia bacterium]|nr:MATE family efflux transporter [Clostridia bacterium]
MKIHLSDHFTFGRLIRYTLPSIITMIFTSIYGIVDGFFVSNFAGKEEFTAVNFIMPFIMILGGVGFMFGTGGGALIATTLGEGKRERANRIFSLIVYTAFSLGVVISVVGIALIRSVASFLGAEGELLENSVIYARIILAANPVFILQYVFQCLFSTAEKPKYGLYITVAAGAANIVLDVLFVGVLSQGLVGAALATVVSQCVGGFLPVIYFARKNSSLLRLGKTKIEGRVLLRACTNGSSEFLSNISTSVVSMVYNSQLLKYSGEDGVAAYGVLMYVCMIFMSVSIGFSVGCAPIVSYHYGAGNKDELRGLLKKSVVLLVASSAFMFVSAELLSRPLSLVFVSYDEGLLALTTGAFKIFSFSFLFSGFTVFVSSFFTALGNGFVSAAVSFSRTFVFQIAAVLLLPLVFAANGIWAASVAAEACALIVGALFLFANNKRYGYMKNRMH